MYTGFLNFALVAYAALAVMTLRHQGVRHHPLRPVAVAFFASMAAGAAGLLLRPIL